jgi:phosphoribosyl 1,2-cyclic phosphodiesterase
MNAAAEAVRPALAVRFWGVRGSIPTTDSSTARFGGNTSCVEVIVRSGRRIILDAGTGIRPLGRELIRAPGPIDADLFITHFHLDHVQGLLFFEPLLRPATLLRIHAPPQNGLDAQALLCGEIATTWFPVPLSEIGARLDVRNAAPEFWLDGGVRVASLRVTHGGHTVGYRIDADGASVVYVPDNELAADAGERSFDELRRFAQGADLLIHGAMFTVPEYATRTGWGHSTFERALELATRADARRLCIFHHAPDRTDEELDGIVDGMNEAARGRTIVMAAAEGIGMELEGSARV